MHALRTQLSWTHFRELIAIDDPLRRQFYTELCRVERWSTRTLTELPPRELLERKLLESIEHARARAATKRRDDRKSR